MGICCILGVRGGHGASGELTMGPHTGKMNSCEDGRKHHVVKALAGCWKQPKQKVLFVDWR